MGDDLLLHEVAEGSHALGLPQLLRVGQEDGHLARLHLRQDADQGREVLGHVVGQDADAQVVEHALKDAEVVVDCQETLHVVGQEVLDERGAGGHLGRARPLADQAVARDVVEAVEPRGLLQVGA